MIYDCNVLYALTTTVPTTIETTTVPTTTETTTVATTTETTTVPTTTGKMPLLFLQKK